MKYTPVICLLICSVTVWKSTMYLNSSLGTLRSSHASDSFLERNLRLKNETALSSAILFLVNSFSIVAICESNLSHTFKGILSDHFLLNDRFHTRCHIPRCLFNVCFISYSTLNFKVKLSQKFSWGFLLKFLPVIF